MKNLIKEVYLQKLEKLNQIKKDIPAYYSYQPIIEENLEQPTLSRDRLLTNEEERFLLLLLAFLKTSIFYYLIAEEHIFQKFLKDVDFFMEINKNLKEIEDFEEIKKQRKEYKKYFLTTYSEEGTKRISSKAKLEGIKKDLKHIKKTREKFLNILKKQSISPEEFEKFILEENKTLIRLNPSKQYYQLLLTELKKINPKKPEFLNNPKYPKIIEWGLDRIKEIMDILVLFNIRLTIKETKRYQSVVPNKLLTFNDLKSEGIIALIDAIWKIDVSQNLKLSTYVTWWIKQRIIQSLNKYRTTVTIPLYYSRIMNEYQKIKQMLEGVVDPSDEEIAKRMGISLKKLQNAKNFMARAGNVAFTGDGKADGTDEEVELEDKVALQFEGKTIEDILEQEETFKIIVNLIEEDGILNENEKYIIKERFFNEVTLSAISKKLNLTPERVRQIENGAINKLKEALKKYYQISERFNL